MNLVYPIITSILVVSQLRFLSSHQTAKSLSDKLLNTNVTGIPGNEYGEFQVVQSNVLQIKSLTRQKRDAQPQSTARSRNDKKYKHDKKKKKKKKGGLYSLIKHMKIPKFLKKMMPMMKGPSMFMMGMAQANLHNFVMHAMMMSKMALGSVIMMIIRELVFGDKDEPVKYYNFGYDVPPRRRVITTIEHPVYKRRRRRHA